MSDTPTARHDRAPLRTLEVLPLGKTYRARLRPALPNRSAHASYLDPVFHSAVGTRLQSFTNVQASQFAATQVVPTAGVHSGFQGGRGVYVRAERGSLPPRASDMLAVRMGN